MANIDPVTGTVLGGFSLVVLAFSKALAKVFKLSNSTLMSTIEQVTKERDQEREEKQEERTRRVAAEYALAIAEIDVARFLQKKGIDPSEFHFSKPKPDAALPEDS